MADLIIKPNSATGDKLILQDRAGGAVLTTADSGATLSNNTQDNITRLGTVTSGTLEDAVTYRNINQDLATTDNPTFANQPICVFAGWMSTVSTTQGSWVNYPLDTIYKAVNTDYLTKSAGEFTCVKAGQYLLNLSCMSYLSEADYTHHAVYKNGTWFHATHSYGVASGDKWLDYGYSVIIDLAVNDKILFKAYTNSGYYLWHDGPNYSQLNIIFLHV